CDNILSGFFFQAEDGIRDRNVTGVQTCALPISRLLLQRRCEPSLVASILGVACGCRQCPRIATAPRPWRPNFFGPCRLSRYRKRSEERRVGKERRLGWVSACG